MNTDKTLEQLATDLTNTVVGHRNRLKLVLTKLSGRQLRRLVMDAASYPAVNPLPSAKPEEKEALMLLNSIAGAREEYLSILRMVTELTSFAASQAAEQATVAANQQQENENGTQDKT